MTRALSVSRAMSAADDALEALGLPAMVDVSRGGPSVSGLFRLTLTGVRGSSPLGNQQLWPGSGVVCGVDYAKGPYWITPLWVGQGGVQDEPFRIQLKVTGPLGFGVPGVLVKWQAYHGYPQLACEAGHMRSGLGGVVNVDVPASSAAYWAAFVGAQVVVAGQEVARLGQSAEAPLLILVRQP